jgi:hypothetical protein
VLLFSSFILKNIVPKGQASNAIVCGTIVARTTVAFTPVSTSSLTSNVRTPKFVSANAILKKANQNIVNFLFKAIAVLLLVSGASVFVYGQPNYISSRSKAIIFPAQVSSENSFTAQINLHTTDANLSTSKYLDFYFRNYGFKKTTFFSFKN